MGKFIQIGAKQWSKKMGKSKDWVVWTEIGMLGVYGFQGQVMAGDGSDKQGKMGAGYNCLRRKQISISAKWDVRKRAPVQISLNWQRFYLRFVTR